VHTPKAASASASASFPGLPISQPDETPRKLVSGCLQTARDKTIKRFCSFLVVVWGRAYRYRWKEGKMIKSPRKSQTHWSRLMAVDETGCVCVCFSRVSFVGSSVGL
jgi:hypothetical protein